MRITRVFVDLPLNEQTQIELPTGPSRHLLQVLRLGVGDGLSLFNGDGRDYSAQVDAIDGQIAVVSLSGVGDLEPEPPLEIQLALGVSRGERMDLALQKAVELGVSGLIPLLTERTLVRLDGTRLQRRHEHWRGIVSAACEQSGRRRIPMLHPLQRLSEWLSDCPAEGALLLDPQALVALTELTPPHTGHLTFLVGPEGGLSQRERDQAQAHGFTGVRLGPRILRTETAPLAAIAAAQTLWGDFAK